MFTAKWIKNTQNNEWFDFLRLDLESAYFTNKKGVYIIWYVDSPSRAIKIGSGNLRDKLKENRSNPEVTKFSSFGSLKVSWVLVGEAGIKEEDLVGIEAFLSNKYSPLIGERYSGVQENPISLIGN